MQIYWDKLFHCKYAAKNHAFPKIEQLLSMANFLHKTVEELVIGKDKNKIELSPRVMEIAYTA